MLTQHNQVETYGRTLKVAFPKMESASINNIMAKVEQLKALVEELKIQLAAYHCHAAKNLPKVLEAERTQDIPCSQSTDKLLLLNHALVSQTKV